MTQSQSATIEAMLDTARDLAAQSQFNVQSTLSLLTRLPTGKVDLQTRGAIRHALLATATAGDQNSRSVVVARYALHRVIVLLEKRNATAVKAAGLYPML